MSSAALFRSPPVSPRALKLLQELRSAIDGLASATATPEDDKPDA